MVFNSSRFSAGSCYTWSITMGFSNWVHIDVDEILRETDKAFLVAVNEVEVWIPSDKDLTLSITEFIAREKGLGE